MAYYILYSEHLGGALLDTSSGVDPSSFPGLTNSVEITEEVYKYMLQAQCEGMTITFESSCNFAVNSQECGECDCVKVSALQANAVRMVDGDKWASVSHDTSTEATSELCLNAGYGNGASAINLVAAQQGGELQFSADYFTFTGGNIEINGKALSATYGTGLRTTDNKRITLHANGTVLSNFDPAEIIANVIQGRGYGYTTSRGSVGAIGLFWTDQTLVAGSTVSGSDLKEIYLDLESADGTTANVIGEWLSYTNVGGTWVALCGTSSTLDSRRLVLAVRTV